MKLDFLKYTLVLFLLLHLPKKCQRDELTLILKALFYLTELSVLFFQISSLTILLQMLSLRPFPSASFLSYLHASTLPQFLPSIQNDVHSHLLSSFALFAHFGAFLSLAIIPTFHKRLLSACFPLCSKPESGQRGFGVPLDGLLLTAPAQGKGAERK